MTDLECGSCGKLADEVVDRTWFDGDSCCQITVVCRDPDCGAETVYELIEPHQIRVFE